MTPKIYIFKDNQFIQYISNELPEGLPLFSCRFDEKINGGSSLLFSIPANHPDSLNVAVGCWAILQDLDGNYRAFVITEETATHSENHIREFITEDLGVYELNTDPVIDVRPYKTSAGDALTRILALSEWNPGIIDDFGTNSTNVYYESCMSGIRKVVETWGGEIRFRVTINEKNQITGRYVDLVSKLGNDTGVRFEFGRNLKDISRYENGSAVYTAAYGRGKGEETDSGGYGRRIDFSSVEWKKSAGKPVDKPKGVAYVADPAALSKYGKLNPDGSRSHNFYFYVNEEQEDPAALLQETWDILQTMNTPQVTYKATVQDLEQVSSGEFKHLATRLGDRVYVIDKNFAYDVRMSVRVVEINRDLLEPKNTQLVLGQPTNDIGSLVDDMQERLNKKIGQGEPIGWLKGVIDAARSEFHSLNGYVYITDQDGILITNRPKDNIENPPNMAIQLKAGALAIANSRNQDGTWNWKTFITGEQIIADMINTGRIRTDNVEIGDSSGNTLINKSGITIKNGALKVYATSDASDPGVLIEGNRIVTNFIKNADFYTQPTATDWALYSIPAGEPGAGARSYWDATKKIIKIDAKANMPWLGIAQSFPVYGAKYATFQALVKCARQGTRSLENARMVVYCYDKNGNRIDWAEGIVTEKFPWGAYWVLLQLNAEFPPGTVSCRIFIQFLYNTDYPGIYEVHWVKGCFDEYATQPQLTQVPQDQYLANPQIQHHRIEFVHGTLTAGTLYGTTVYWDYPFRTGPGHINVQATPYGSNAAHLHVGVKSTTIDSVSIVVRPLINVPAGTDYIDLLSYRISYGISSTWVI